MKTNNIALYAKAIIFGFILWTSNLSASVVTYTLTDVTTVDASSPVSGYVIIDTDLGLYDTIDITVNADPVLGSPEEIFFGHPHYNFIPNTSYYPIESLDFNYVLGYSLFPTGTSTFPQTLALNIPHTAPFLILYSTSGGNPVSLQGSLTETPEPTTAYLMLLGALGMIGGNRLRKYRHRKPS